jgi:hypothetical protein
MAAAATQVSGSLPIAQQQQAPVARNSVILEGKTAEAARRAFAWYAALGLAATIGFAATILTIGAGWHLIVTCPLFINLLYFGIGGVACRAAENVDYDKPMNLLVYRSVASDQSFLSLQEGHGLDNVIKHKILTPGQLKDKFDAHVRRYAAFERWPADRKIFDLPALVRANLMTPATASQLQDLQDHYARIRAARAPHAVPSDQENQAVRALEAQYKILMNI